MQPEQLKSKPHYIILDGLRGVAAILVVIFHLFEGYYPDMAIHPMHHGYLAVDFFFVLSGFVVGYAYDNRWGRMSIKDFLKIRLIRLHPLVILGVLIGSFVFWFDPMMNQQEHTSLLKLLSVMLISFTLLPSPDIRGWGETHSLDGPCWSLLQEYIGNLIYALFNKRMTNIILSVIVGVGAISLIYVATQRGDVGTGWSYNTFWIAAVRMVFPFFAGLLLFRSGKRIKIPFAFPICSLLLVILFFMPRFSFNGLCESACIIIFFPLIVAIGAGGKVSGGWERLSRLSGEISYPIYITHYPFIYIYTEWIYFKKPATQQIIPVAIGLLFFFILLAYIVFRFYDAPVRVWLQKKFLINKK